MLSHAWLWCACAVVACAAESVAAVRYVNAGLTTGSNTGTSWANAYRGPTGLATALNAALANDEIWVAAGTYIPAVAGNRAATFTLKANVDLYGGFAGGESARTQRLPLTNVTILSGDLAGNDAGSSNRGENSHHVMSALSSAITGVDIFGFTIRGGTADAAANADRGGGLIMLAGAQVNFTDCIFTQNSCTFGGGAGYINASTARFTRCTFSNNSGGAFGGAFDTNDASTTFSACVFSGNTAGRAGGLEVFGPSGRSFIYNTLFQGNTATGNNGGGALWIGQTAQCTIANGTIVGNAASTGLCGGVQSSSTLTMRNSIVWNNTGTSASLGTRQMNTSGTAVVEYSCVAGGRVGTGNIASDPILLANGSLRWGSPCIDAANGALLAGDFATDLAQKPREVNDPATPDTGVAFLQRGMPDMGAFEFQRSSCVADVASGSGATPDGAITIEDLLQYLSWFESGNAGADVDNGAGGGVPDEGVEISDLLYLLGRFEGGC
jgi:Right handed beta helix region